MNKMETAELETNREKQEAPAVHQEVPKEEAAAETIGAEEDRYEDQRPTVGYRNPRK
jgi:hypothetical protein